MAIAHLATEYVFSDFLLKEPTEPKFKGLRLELAVDKMVTCIAVGLPLLLISLAFAQEISIGEAGGGGDGTQGQPGLGWHCLGLAGPTKGRSHCTQSAFPHAPHAPPNVATLLIPDLRLNTYFAYVQSGYLC